MPDRTTWKLKFDPEHNRVYLFKRDSCRWVNYGSLSKVKGEFVCTPHTPSKYIPKYLQLESESIIDANPLELRRGYTTGGAPCRPDEVIKRWS